MKSYPSIPTVKEAGIPKIPSCIAFEKLDGSNIRVEYSKNKWDKFGTRTQLLDPSSQVFGPVIPIFKRQWEEELSQILKKNKVQKAVAFFEFYGPSSFAGVHEPNEEKFLTLIDISIYKQGILPARQFVKMFQGLEIPRIVYEGNLNKQVVEDVEKGLYNVDEGIVAKGGNKHSNLWMRKVKTDEYLAKLKAHGIEE